MTANKVTFGMRLPLSGPLSTAENIIKVAKESEALDYDAIMAHDKLISNPGDEKNTYQMGAVELSAPPPTSFECLTTLSFVAGLTSKIRIGADILVLPYGREPITMAKQIATLDVLSNGRFICGIGMGHDEPYHVFVKNPPKYKGQVGDEIVQIFKNLWTEPVSSFNGKYFSYKDLAQYPKPVQKPLPIWVGGKSKWTLDRVARYGNGWMPGPGREGTPPETFIDGGNYLKERVKKYGRRIGDIKFAWEGLVSIDRDRNKAIEKARLTAKKRFDGTMEDWLRFNLIGNPDDIIKNGQIYLDAGVSDFEIKLVGQSMDHIFKSMKLLSDEVFPTFKK